MQMRETRFDLAERILTTAAAAALGLAVAVTPALAQQGTVTGQVTDAADLQPLQGVQVFIPDTELGVLTSEDGSFRLTGVPAGQVRLRARLIGYRQVTQTVQVEPGESVTVDFELPVSAVSLQEVVVTATGDQSRRQLGNAISTVDAAEVAENRIASNLTGLLQGQSTGVTIRENAGSVGAASSLNIRGFSSLGLDNTPLIYVDGARIDNSNNIDAGAGGQAFSQINDINPEDIESIEIVKGPAAAALYGTEAAAGVIRISTKSGSATGDTRYSFRVEQGANWDATDWWGMAWNPADITGFGFGKDTTYTINLLDGSDEFFETPWRTGHLQTYGGSVRGGGQNVTYFVSGKYDDEEGNTRPNDLRRWNGRANFNVAASDKVDLSVSTGFTSNRIGLPQSDNNLQGYASNALGLPWNGRMVRADPNAGGEPIETCFLAFEIARAFGTPLEDANAECGSPFFAAPVDKIDEIQSRRNQERFTGSATLSYRPIDFMTNRVTLGYDESDAKLFNLFPVDPARPFGADSDGFLFRRNSSSRNLTLDVTSTLSFDLAETVTSQTTVGAQYYRETIDATEAIGRVFPAGSPAVNNAVTNEGDDFFIESRTAGVFVEERLGWNDRLFLTPALRLDDNAAFGENLGLEAYPSVQASWVVSDQPGFPELFDQLRLRAAWGQAGKQPGPNDALALLTPVPVTLRAEDILGVTASQPGNPELKPETGEEIEVGFDASVLDGRLGLEFTYYDQTTRDAIVQRQLPPSLGFPSQEFTNIGELTNRGIEVGLDARMLDRSAVVWDWRLNLTSNDNEITRLENPIVSGSQRHTEGFPFASYFTEEVSLDADGNAVVAEEATFHGHPTPEWEGSLSSTVTLVEHVTLYGLLDFAWGHQLENGLEGFSCAFLACPEIIQRTEEGELTEEARIKRAAAFSGSESPWITDADWMKLRSLSLRFELPQAWAQAFSTSGMSLRVAGENLALWTTYDGTDPEANFAGPDPLNRAQLWTIPPARRFLATLSLTF
jgi:TonB-linked SusC/RagA family outer membrane protein